GDLVRLRLVERRGDAFFVRSPGLLGVALRLEKAGIDLETATESSRILKKHLERCAHELVQHFVKRIGEGFGDGTAEGLGVAYEALRPTGFEAVRIIFAREMERELRQLIESGATAEVTRRSKKGKGR